ncbi:MAG: hypothetical protein ACOCYT_00450 [Chloroflexota bacterium]
MQKVWIVVVTLAVLLMSVSAPGQATQVDRCVGVIGDSIPAGTFVVEAPGLGFPVVRAPTFASVLAGYLGQVGALDVRVMDYSVSASSLSGRRGVPYTKTAAWRAALTSGCQAMMIFPWLNDLPPAPEATLARAYTLRLRLIAWALRFFDRSGPGQPERVILMLSHYPVIETPVGQLVYEGTLNNVTVGVMSAAWREACTERGVLGAQRGIRCLDLGPLLQPTPDYVLQTIPRAVYEAQGYAPAEPQFADVLNVYWQTNPDGALVADGAHLNATGKQRVAVAVAAALGYGP